MDTRPLTFREVAFKTVVVHTVTYFCVGFLAYSLFNYAQIFAGSDLRGFMRQTSDPLVAAGPLFQPLRGLLFAAAFYPLRQVLFGQRNGWLITWSLLVSIGIFSTFGPSPGSIEGMIYTTWPLNRHLGGLVEILAQSFLLSWLLCLWVNRPGSRWLNWGLVTIFVVVMVLPIMGLLARTMLPAA